MTGLNSATASVAQSVLPSQVTPQSMAPSAPRVGEGLGGLSIGGGDLKPPPGSEKLDIHLSAVEVDNTFEDLTDEIAGLTGAIVGKRISVATVYAFALAVEQAHARAGYVLARVTVPPQRLVDGGRLKVIVVDGYIDKVKVDGVAEKARDSVMSRTSALIGKKHITINEIERALLNAGDLSGLQLRSALVAGDGLGATTLVLEGFLTTFTRSVAFDNYLPKNLGRMSGQLSLAVNGVMGFGEQGYVNLSGSLEPSSLEAGEPRLRTFGIGMQIPLGTSGLMFNPEFTSSKTRPLPSDGAPKTVANFLRQSLRLSYPWLRTRVRSLNLSAAFENISQVSEIADFGQEISRDRYRVLRLAADIQQGWEGGLVATGRLRASRGIGGRSVADAVAANVPLTRAGAEPSFLKFDGELRLQQAFLESWRASVMVRGQSSLRKPLLESERFTMASSDALSSFAQGALVADEGALVRTELEYLMPFEGAAIASLRPYVFVAGAVGFVSEPTAVEIGRVRAGAAGIGVRTTASDGELLSGATFGVELARGFSNVASASMQTRISFVGSVRF